MNLSETNSGVLNKILAFASVVEVGTGLALLLAPALIVSLLAGAGEAGDAMPLARFPGIALLAFGLACWPASGHHADRGSPVFRGMLTYNVLVALFLVYMFAVEHIGGVLLWPGVVLHAVVALLLVWSSRGVAPDSKIDK
jgi:hypothetical protein